MARLKEKYEKEVRPALQEKFGYKNAMLIPRLKKVVVSMGITEAAKDKGVMEDHLNELGLITGQRPLTTCAKKSIANFKLREGQAIGAKVTLRRDRMWEFIDRFMYVDAPRIRDFRGFKRRTSLGIESQEIFHCLDLDKIKRTQGMNIQFVITGKEEEALELMTLLGVPFKKEDA